MNDEHNNSEKLKSYFDDVSEQYEKGNTINEVEAIERMRLIREKSKTRHDRDVDFDN